MFCWRIVDIIDTKANQRRRDINTRVWRRRIKNWSRLIHELQWQIDARLDQWARGEVIPKGADQMRLMVRCSGQRISVGPDEETLLGSLRSSTKHVCYGIAWITQVALCSSASLPLLQWICYRQIVHVLVVWTK